MVFRVQNYKKMLIDIRFGNEYSYRTLNFKLNVQRNTNNLQLFYLVNFLLINSLPISSI